jgi:hypothetical protein
MDYHALILDFHNRIFLVLCIILQQVYSTRSDSLTKYKAWAGIRLSKLKIDDTGTKII